MSSLTSILDQFESEPAGPQPTENDWSIFEAAVERSVPDDFKKIVEHTRGASMGWCCLRNPAERDNMAMALTMAAMKREHIVWNDIYSKMMGVTLFPEPGGLIQLAHVGSVSFMLSYHGDNIVICDRGGWEVFETGLVFSDLIWSLFTNRAQYDDLGMTIWRSSNNLFGWPEM